MSCISTVKIRFIIPESSAYLVASQIQELLNDSQITSSYHLLFQSLNIFSSNNIVTISQKEIHQKTKKKKRQQRLTFPLC